MTSLPTTTDQPFNGAEPAQILAAHGIGEDQFLDASVEEWADLCGDVGFNFPYLLAELLHAASDIDDDGMPFPHTFDDQTFMDRWVSVCATAACRRMVFSDDERIRREVERLAPWLREARRRGLVSPVPPPKPRDDRNDLADALVRMKEVAAGTRPPSSVTDLLGITQRTIGQIITAATSAGVDTVTELAAMQADSVLAWPEFIDSLQAADGGAA